MQLSQNNNVKRVLEPLDISNLAKVCGQDTTTLNSFFFGNRDNPKTNLEAGITLLKTINIGLDSGKLPIENLVQIKDNFIGAFNEGRLKWEELTQEQQQDFHSQVNSAIKKVDEINSVKLSNLEKLKIKNQLTETLIPITRVDLSHEEIKNLMTEHERKTLGQSVEKFLNEPENSNSTGSYYVGEVFKDIVADKNQLSCHQKCQLMKLSLQAYGKQEDKVLLEIAERGYYKTLNALENTAKTELDKKIIGEIRDSADKLFKQ